MTDLGSIRECRQANSQIKTLHSLQTSFEEEISYFHPESAAIRTNFTARSLTTEKYLPAHVNSMKKKIKIKKNQLPVVDRHPKQQERKGSKAARLTRLLHTKLQLCGGASNGH